MTTYELIRHLAKLDPTGDMSIMLSVRRTNDNGTVDDASGFVESFSMEQVEDDGTCYLVLEAVDM